MTHEKYIPQEWSTTLKRWQDFTVELYKARTEEDFIQVDSFIGEYNLPDTHIRTYNELLRPNQYKLHVTNEKPAPRYTPPAPVANTTINPTTPMTTTQPQVSPTSPEAISKTYEKIDQEQFKEPAPIKIEVSGTPEAIDPMDCIPATVAQPVVESTVIAPKESTSNEQLDTTAGLATEETVAKRKRTSKESPVQTVQVGGWVTIHREVKCPIEGIEYSGNLFGMDVTAPTYEEAKAILDAGFESFLADSGLVRRTQVTELEKISYNKGIAEGKKMTPPAPAITKRSDADDLELRRYDRVKLFMQELAKDARIAPIMAEIRDKFAVTNPKF